MSSECHHCDHAHDFGKPRAEDRELESKVEESFAACAGAIGGFAGPYVVGALVDTRGGYVTCMQVLGGLFLVQSAMIICEPHHLSLAKAALVYIAWHCWQLACNCWDVM